MACTESQIKSGKLVIPQDGFGTLPPNDTGARPLVPCGAYWFNPNMWLETNNPPLSSGVTTGLQTWVAQEGVPCYAAVQVLNPTGSDIGPVHIEVWVCNYTMGVSPSTGLVSAGAPKPMTGSIAVIPARQLKVVRSTFVWKPTHGDAVLNGGHVCLAANVYSPTDGQSFESGKPTAFAFCCDSHHAQRNIHIDVLSMMKKATIASAEVFAANPTDKDVEVQVRLIERQGDGALHPSIMEQLRREHLSTGAHPSNKPPKRASLSGRGIGPGTNIKVKIPAKGRVPLTLQVEIDPHEPQGALHAFDVVQEDLHGENLGGVAFVTVVVP
jgi:hypothetical protein